MDIACDHCGREMDESEACDCPLCDRTELCERCIANHDCESSAGAPEHFRESNRRRRPADRT